MTSDSSLTEWARLLFGTLAQTGIEEILISPGSRSTPFTFAALSTPGLRCQSVWDERCAGFVALGQARVRGRPSLLLCTSGSAAAGYFPAIVEAAGSYTPLLVLTADRPFELQDCGAPQCMDQVKLYGGFARHYFELGQPDPAAGALDALQRMLAQAVEASLAPLPGPVHLNARARKPLEPVAAVNEASRALRAAVDRRLERGPTRTYSSGLRAGTPAGVEALTRACQAHARGLIVCGPMADASALDGLLELAAATGYPLFAEATSQLRFAKPAALSSAVTWLGALDALFASPLLETHAPELVLVCGAAPTSSAFERWRAQTDANVAVLTPHGFLDPASRARWLVQGDVGSVASEVGRALTRSGSVALRRAQQEAFVSAWQAADERYYELVQDLVRRERALPLTEAVAVQLGVAALPRGAWLGLGNSLPVRDIDAFVAPAAGGLRVWSQRGVNGIDGLVSGAVGAATVARAPSLTLLGDISFLHDVGGLAAARELESPLVLLVIDNGGGRIFEELPIATTLADRPELLRFWTTPHALELGHAAALYGLPYAPVNTAAELTRAVEAALQHRGCSVVHARVVPDSAREARRQLRTGLHAAIGGVPA